MSMSKGLNKVVATTLLLFLTIQTSFAATLEVKWIIANRMKKTIACKNLFFYPAFKLKPGETKTISIQVKLIDSFKWCGENQPPCTLTIRGDLEYDKTEGLSIMVNEGKSPKIKAGAEQLPKEFNDIDLVIDYKDPYVKAIVKNVQDLKICSLMDEKQ